MNTLFGEFGIVDILVVLNYLETRKTNKNLKQLQRLQIYAQVFGDDELNEILKEIQEWKKNYMK